MRKPDRLDDMHLHRERRERKFLNPARKTNGVGLAGVVAGEMREVKKVERNDGVRSGVYRRGHRTVREWPTTPGNSGRRTVLIKSDEKIADEMVMEGVDRRYQGVRWRARPTKKSRSSIWRLARAPFRVWLELLSRPLNFLDENIYSVLCYFMPSIWNK